MRHTAEIFGVLTHIINDLSEDYDENEVIVALIIATVDFCKRMELPDEKIMAATEKAIKDHHMMDVKRKPRKTRKFN